MRSLLVLATAAGFASATTIRVDAGSTNSSLELTFIPASVTASPGDVVEFHFLPKNHSVGMGSFDSPCRLAEQGGFFSGYWPAQEGQESSVFESTVFRVTVNDTNPIWYYCTQPHHCKAGMVGVINPPSDQTLEEYAESCEAFNGTVQDSVIVYGGEMTVSNNTGSGNTPGGSASNSPTATSSGAAGPQILHGSVFGASLMALLGLSCTA
ncbi:Cupredoxin [Xylariales sp. PMI_506]|nr:Cupredoxin [Xylariales sp. PMI_506]